MLLEKIGSTPKSFLFYYKSFKGHPKKVGVSRSTKLTLFQLAKALWEFTMHATNSQSATLDSIKVCSSKRPYLHNDRIKN